MFGGEPAFETCVVLFAVAPDAQFEEVGQCVYNGYTHPVQTARNFVGIAVELSAGVQLGHDNFGG